MQRHLLAICFDFGDTLVDEASEVKDEREVTLYGELIPGAAQMVHGLKARGHRLAIVSDGPVGNVDNVLSQTGLLELFDAFAISQTLGVEKPDSRMFVHALEQLGVARDDYGRAMMVGNNLARDVKGANQLGMISVWLNWAPRYAKQPCDGFEVPQFTIKQPLDLLPLVDWLERQPAARRQVGNLSLPIHQEPDDPHS